VIKNKVAIERMRAAGELLAGIIEEIRSSVAIGSSTLEIDSLIEAKMRAACLKPECIGYGGYKHATCISLNDVIVHGIPSKEIVLKSGDFVKIDVVGSYKGYCADISRYFFIGDVSPVVRKLAQVAQNALDEAIKKIVPGVRISDISACIQQEVEQEGFNVIREFTGHGIGKSMHEQPDIPNFGRPGLGVILQPGMTLAIEPMIAERGYHVKVMPDGWTAKTVDGGMAAHVEDTVLVTSDGADVLTRLTKEQG